MEIGVTGAEQARRLQEHLREARQRRRWQQQQPRISALTVEGERNEAGDSSDDDGGEAGQNTTHYHVPSVLDATDGGCSGNAGRPSLMAPTTSTPPQESSSSSSSTVAPRQETGGQWESTVRIREVEPSWWEGVDEIPVFGWFVGGPRGEDGVVRVASYFANGRATLMTASKFKEGASKAKRHVLGEGGQPPATNAINLTAPLQLGAWRYLADYVSERRTLPRQDTWAKLLKGGTDHRGEVVAAEFLCQLCARRRRVAPKWAKEVEATAREGSVTCKCLRGGRCEDGVAETVVREWEDRVKEESDWMFESLKEDERGEEKEDVKREDEEEGFSAAAKQFYKATGKFMQVPVYRGETSEVDFMAWTRGTERYFSTYGIHQEKEKVAIAADLLGGEASLWWNGLWMSGRDKEITTWRELLERLRERFIPPEGEMKIIGQWKRLHQVGSVANYADFVFRLKALCDMGAAEFKLALYGLRPELQAEVRKYLRQKKVSSVSLETLFAIATDAEVGLGGGRRNEEVGETKKKEKPRVLAVQMEGKGKQKPPQGMGEQPSAGGKAGELCWVCDKVGHGWFYCPAKVKGQCCPRCGSSAHRLYTCPQRPSKAGTQEKKTVSVLQRIFAQDGEKFSGLGLRFYVVKLDKKEMRVLVDSGASVNCIDAEVLSTLGGEVQQVAPGRLYFADQRQADVLGTARIQIHSKGHQEVATFWVVKGLGVSALLGESWLRSWNPRIDWKTGDLTFSDGIRWKAARPVGERKGSRVGDNRGESARRRQLRQLMEIRGEGGGREQEGEEPDWITGYQEVFEDPEGVRQGGGVAHRIVLKEGSKCHRRAAYRMAPREREVLRRELEEFWARGWIRPSTSEWATVALVVPKKDGTARVCIDYRDLNALTVQDGYPLPKIDELLQKMAKARWYSKVDLKSGFHQIPMERGSIQYTAFRVGEPVQGCSLFEWEVMPMGLSTAPSTFQRWMDAALQGLEDVMVVYLDDVLIYSATKEEHEKDIRRVFDRFREKGMRVKRSKCEFMRQEIAFLGHVIKDGRILVDETKLSRLDEWEAPLTEKKQVRQFMGFASYYRAFIPNFATLTAPLTSLLRNVAHWEWTEEATAAMRGAKRALLDSCERYAWDAEREDRVTTDASGVGIGAVFEQRVEGVGWAPVAFWSRKLSEAEGRYSATDQEWLAVVEAVTKQWRHWLKGRKFVLRSDHGALRQLLTTKGEFYSNRQHRWAEKMQDYHFEFQHIPGPSNTAADALSRAPAFYISALELGKVAEANNRLGWDRLIAATKEDKDYQGELESVRKKGGSWKEGEGGVLVDNVGRIRMPASPTLRFLAILEAHEPAFCGHLGVKRTEESVSRAWWWEGWRRDVREVVASCDTCQRFADTTRLQEAPMVTVVAVKPWEVVTMDFMSGLTPSSPGGWKGCVVVCDRFTRMMHVKECNTHPTANEAARLFIQLVVRAHGIPQKILTDRGTQFESLLWEEVMQKLGTKVALASTHHPQTNGLTERMNRTLLGMVRKVCANRRDQWVEALPLMEFAYNNSRHASTGVSPFVANEGRNPLVPATLLIPAVVGGARQEPKTYAEKLEIVMREIHKTVTECGAKADLANKRREDAKRGNPTFAVGDEVMCQRFHLAVEGEEVRKQDYKYDGPFVVERMLGPGVVALRGLPKGSPTSINVQFLRKYHRLPTADALRATPPPPKPTGRGETQVWEVEAILRQRSRGRSREFLLKWKGYPRPTWVARKDLVGCQELLQEFRERERMRLKTAGNR